MYKSKSFMFFCVSMAIFSLAMFAGVNKGYAAEGYRYATTSMTWAEFYAGETGQTASQLEEAGLDAVTSPTTNAISRFPLLVSSSDEKGSVISGVRDVQVRMTNEIYDALANKGRFTLSDKEFSEFKEVKPDGSFGPMVTQTVTPQGASVSISTGPSSRWGHYTLTIKGANADIGLSGDKIARNYLGALLETSDGKIYGLRHDCNLWSDADNMAFCIDASYVEPHGRGVQRDYDYTADLAGKTITKITYMLKDLPDVIVNCNEFVKMPTSAEVTPERASYTVQEGAASLEVRILSKDFPAGASYDVISVKIGIGRNAKDASYTYAGGVLTIDKPVRGTYTVTFGNDPEFIDIAASFDVIYSYNYATTNMSWAEFYAGETGRTSSQLKDDGLDAVSSPTTRIAGRFTQLVSTSDDKGAQITGVKAVQVRMTDEIYNALANKSRYTFLAGTFDEYKEVSSDGSFGPMVTQSVDVDAKVTLSSGPSSTWGNYTLNISGANITLASGDTRYDLGATLTTDDGKIYGLRHNSNLWFNANSIALSIKEFVEPHGVSRDYKYTSDLEGKTIKKITFMLKDKPDVNINCDVFIKKQTSATVTPSPSEIPASTAQLTMNFSGLPEGAEYDVSSIYSGSGRNKVPFTAYTYSKETKTLILNEAPASGTYTVIFSDGVYVDIAGSFDVSYHFATRDMTWAEFYAGETGRTVSELETDGLDAITSPTTNAITRFPLLISSSNDKGSEISGVKAVQVRMSEEVYKALSKDERYTFSDVPFSEYKEVNSDGTFGKMITETVTANNAKVTLASGASSTWGNYTLTIASADIDIGLSGDKVARKYLGATITTSDGVIYGLRHDCNLWSDAGSIAFCVNADYVEPHGRGVMRDYDYTASLEGKTITKITYMLKDIPDVVINCNIYVKKQTNAKVSGHADAGTNVPVIIVFDDVPEGASYSLTSIYIGSGRNRTFITDYTYSDGVLTINGELIPGENYMAVFSDEEYADISTTFQAQKSYYATTAMTWAEFYAGEIGKSSSELQEAGLDAVTSPTINIARRLASLFSGDITSTDAEHSSRIHGPLRVPVRMSEQVYSIFSQDIRYSFDKEASFTKHKEVSSDGSFGKMITTTRKASAAKVTLSSGASSRWGNYLLNVTSSDIVLGNGNRDVSYYLGAVIETASGDKYGMRYNSNLWTSPELAISFKEFNEAHGYPRQWQYTKGLEGKTIKRITFMLRESPDVEVDYDVYLKKFSDASVSPETPKVLQGYPLKMIFSNVPSDAGYDISSVSFGSGRNSRAINNYTYSEGLLTIGEGLETGTYNAIFKSDLYSDIGTSFEVATTEATDLIISKDNNKGGVSFLLTPAGVVSSVDKHMAEGNFISASDCTSPDKNHSVSVFQSLPQVEGSGFSFDITLNNVPAGKIPVVGVGKQFYLTHQNCGGEIFSYIFKEINALTPYPSGYRAVDGEMFKKLGLRVISVYGENVMRDITDYIGAGAFISDDTHIGIYYGVMLADRDITNDDEGNTHAFSPEGETLISDGVKDNHLKATWYIMLTAETGAVDEAKNAAGLEFSYMPKGLIPGADTNTDAKKLAWISRTGGNTSGNGSSSLVNGKPYQVSGDSGFTFTVPIDQSKISPDYSAIIGFEREFTFTKANLGSDDFDVLKAQVEALPSMPSNPEWKDPEPKGAYVLNAANVFVMASYPSRSDRNITGEIQYGIKTSGDLVIMRYGAIAVNREISPDIEGELLDMVMEKSPLVSDGNNDSELSITWYIAHYSDEVQDVGINGLEVRPRYSGFREVSHDVEEVAYSLISGSSDIKPLSSVKIISPRDPKTIFDELKAELIARTPAQVLALVLPEASVSEDGYYLFRVPINNVKNARIFAYTKSSDKAPLSGDKLIFISDIKPQSLDVISGDEYVNVAAYMLAGEVYAPFITAEASANDAALVRNNINPPSEPSRPGDDNPSTPSTPTSPDVPATPTSPDVPVTPTSPDVPVTPTSPDVPVTPTSPDVPVNPTSPDIPINPNSPDVPVTPPASPDTPVTPPAGPTSPDNPATPDTPDNPGGNDTPSTPDTPTVEPVAVIPEAPAVEVDDVAEVIIEILSSLSQTLADIITPETEVAELPANASGGERTIEDVSEENLAAIPQTETPAVVLPIITVTRPAVYVFGVKLDNLEVGALIFLHMMAEDYTGGPAMYASEADTEAYTFLDDSGKETNRVPVNKHINVAAYMEPSKSYAPIITTIASSSTPETPDNSPHTPGSPGGGCDSIDGLLPMMTFAIMFMFTRKK